MANPVLVSAYESVVHPQDRVASRVVTLDDVLVKTLSLFAVVLPVAAAVYFLMPPALASMVTLVAGLATVVMSLIFMAKRAVSPPLMFVMAALEGAFVGGLSASYGHLFEGAVATALLATTVTAGVIIAGVKAGFLRTSPKARKIFFYAVLGYMAFSLVAVVASLMGFHVLTLGSPLALAISVFGTLMAAFAFVTDVEDVQEAVAFGAPAGTDWYLAYGLMVSLVWLYVEILRLVANISALVRD